VVGGAAAGALVDNSGIFSQNNGHHEPAVPNQEGVITSGWATVMQGQLDAQGDS
jgi:hypothetical protein